MAKWARKSRELIGDGQVLIRTMGTGSVFIIPFEDLAKYHRPDLSDRKSQAAVSEFIETGMTQGYGVEGAYSSPRVRDDGTG